MFGDVAAELLVDTQRRFFLLVLSNFWIRAVLDSACQREGCKVGLDRLKLNEEPYFGVPMTSGNLMPPPPKKRAKHHKIYVWTVLL